MQYVIITPVRDEEKYIERTIESVLSQTIKPVEWVIVDDGSSDGTGMVIDGYASRYQWVNTVHRSNRGFRKAGEGVMEAFQAGYHSLKSRGWDFLVKLDGDLVLDSDYFETCFEQFRKNPNLGIGGGQVCHVIGGRTVPEPQPRFHVRGATKIYRRECWTAIGGLVAATGWDTIDEVKANMLGWETRTFSDIKIIQLRQTGAALGMWRNWIKNGRANYIAGYHPLFMLLKCFRLVGQKPYLIGAIGACFGFITGYTKRIPQIEDKALIEYLRKQQLMRLLGRKTIWR